MKKIKKETRPESLSLVILKIIGLSVAVTAASIISPPFLYLLVKGYLKYKLKGKYTRLEIQKSLVYLRRKKFIAYKNDNPAGKIILTTLGKKKLKRIQFHQIQITKSTWDGRWRFLFFDISESYRSERHLFRKKLQAMGFYHFQRSVFVTPYECTNEIDTLKMILGLESSVYIVTADRFAGDKKLLKEFDLKK